MTPPFDPYHRWLGIPPSQRPLTPQVLLGISATESDPDVIDAAAERQMAHVKKYSLGPHASLAQRLLNELAAARRSLLDPQNRARYEFAATAETSPVPHVQQALLPPSELPLPAAILPGLFPPADTPRKRPSGGPFQTWLGIAVGGAIASLFLGLLLVLVSRTLSSAPEIASSPQFAPSGARSEKQSAPAPLAELPPNQTDVAASPPPAEPPKKAHPASPVPAQPVMSEPTIPEPNPPPMPEPPKSPVPAVTADTTPLPPSQEPTPPSPQADTAVDGRLPVPATADSDKALNTLKEVLKEDYGQAKTADKRSALAKKLLHLAKEPSTEAVNRYVLLKETLRLSSDLATIKESSEQLETHFQRSALLELGTGLYRYRETVEANTLPEYVELLLAAIHRGEQEERFDIALKLGETGQTVARKLGERRLMPVFIARQKRTRELQQARQQVQDALTVLNTSPQDAAASLEAGRYYAFLLGNWQGGLPLLAQSSDAALAQLAKQDLAHPKDVKQQMVLGDQWWAVAEKEEPLASREVRQRARYWYALAAPWIRDAVEQQKLSKRQALTEDDPLAQWRANRPEAKLAALVPGRYKLSVYGLDGKPLTDATIDFTAERQVTDSGRLIADWKIDRNTLVMTFIDPVHGVVYLTAADTKGWVGKNIERPDGKTWLWELARQ